MWLQRVRHDWVTNTHTHTPALTKVEQVLVAPFCNRIMGAEKQNMAEGDRTKSFLSHQGWANLCVLPLASPNLPGTLCALNEPLDVCSLISLFFCLPAWTPIKQVSGHGCGTVHLVCVLLNWTGISWLQVALGGSGDKWEGYHRSVSWGVRLQVTRVELHETELPLSGPGHQGASEPHAVVGCPGFLFPVSDHLGIFHPSVSWESLAENPGNFCPHLHPWKPHHKEFYNPPNTLHTGGITPWPQIFTVFATDWVWAWKWHCLVGILAPQTHHPCDLEQANELLMPRFLYPSEGDSSINHVIGLSLWD